MLREAELLALQQAVLAKQQQQVAKSMGEVLVKLHRIRIGPPTADPLDFGKGVRVRITTNPHKNREGIISDMWSKVRRPRLQTVWKVTLDVPKKDGTKEVRKMETGLLILGDQNR